MLNAIGQSGLYVKDKVAYDAKIYGECLRLVYLEEVERLRKIKNSTLTAIAREIKITPKEPDRTFRKFQKGVIPKLEHVVQLANYMHEAPSRIYERASSYYRTNAPALMKQGKLRIVR